MRLAIAQRDLALYERGMTVVLRESLFWRGRRVYVDIQGGSERSEKGASIDGRNRVGTDY